jgi:predicted membrane channel-forming protein YqfA (hemolysin III family)
MNDFPNANWYNLAMNQSMLFLGLLLLAVILESIADVSFKFSHLENKSLYLWAGVVLYTIGTIIWAFFFAL